MIALRNPLQSFLGVTVVMLEIPFYCLFFRTNPKSKIQNRIMAWIKTIKFEEADEKLQEILMKTRINYPPEYDTPVKSASPINRTRSLICFILKLEAISKIDSSVWSSNFSWLFARQKPT